jgi:hypothetical protein
MLDCGTGALGAQVYASFSGMRRIVPNTCKCPACSSCGQRAALDFQRAIDATLPDIPYYGVLFTIRKELWEIFRENRHLLYALPTIAAEVLQSWADKEHGARLPIIGVLHTFGSRLDFKPHVHLIVPSVGLNRSGNNLIRDVHWSFYYIKEALLKQWRHAIVDHLLTALERGLITSTRPKSELRALLEYQRDLLWFGGVRECKSKRALINYVSRYLRRPPIAMHKILYYDGERVRFRYRDKKRDRIEVQEYSAREFILRFVDQIPNRYKHGVHYFDLLAPGCKGGPYEAFLRLLRYKRRSRPRRTPWRVLFWMVYKIDPLRATNGEIMQKIGWLGPDMPEAAVVQILRQ